MTTRIESIGNKSVGVRRVGNGAILGAVIGLTAAWLDRWGILWIPGFRSVLDAAPFYPAVTGAFLGGALGAGIVALAGVSTSKVETPRQEIPQNDTVDFEGKKPEELDESTLQLLEERLDISKRQIQTGEVTVHRETFTEERNLSVPVTREELIIEKRIFNREAEMEGQTEFIRIPIREERIEVVKHPVELEEVDIYTRQYQKTEQVEAALKKEKLKVETAGDAKVINIEEAKALSRERK